MTAIPLLLLGLGSPAWASSTWGGHTYYVGDPHAHSGASHDGWASDMRTGCGTHSTCGLVSALFETALSNGMDWVGISDHVNGSSAASDDEYLTVLDKALEADDEAGGLVTIPSGEVWFRDSDGKPLGHKNILLFGSDDELSSLTLEDLSPSGPESAITTCADTQSWFDDLVSNFGDALLIPHHPALSSPMTTDWSCHTSGEVGVEVYSHFGNSLGDDIDFNAPPALYADAHSVRVALDPTGDALQMGFLGGSDFHGSMPGRRCFDHDDRTYGSGGLTVAVLDEGETLTRTGLYQAILEHRTYATSGPLLPLDVHWSSEGTVLAGLGEEVDAPMGKALTVTATYDPTYETYVDAVYVQTPDGVYDATETAEGSWSVDFPAGAEPPAYAYVAIQIDGASWYAADPCSDGSDTTAMIWVSPNWITPLDHDDDADGVTYAEGDCDDEDAELTPGRAEIWYDGLDEDCLGDDDFDKDADGVEVDADCDDTDATTFPGAVEIWYDGLDEDCLGGDDDDQDGDGSPVSLDCDDTDARTFPGASEVWYDGRDEDCLGDDDDDQDHDGFAVSSDCDDTTAATHPGVRDTWYDGVDSNCDGADDFDKDGDGYRVPGHGGAPDCNDDSSAVHPGATETWYDGIDENCDRKNDFDRDGDHHKVWPWGDDADDLDPTVWRHGH